MLLHDNFIHADMHPGNILVRQVHPSSWGGLAGWLRAKVPGMQQAQTQLVLLDTGMIAELSTNDQASVVSFFKVGWQWGLWSVCGVFLKCICF